MPDDRSSELALQAGAQYALPPIIAAPIDIALRLALGYANLDKRFPGGRIEIDLWTLMGGAVVSRRIDNIFSVYGFLGLNYAYSDLEVRVLGARSSDRSDRDSEIDPALGVGLLIDITPNLSFYGEFMHIDDPWFGIGARWSI